VRIGATAPLPGSGRCIGATTGQARATVWGGAAPVTLCSRTVVRR